ncbi:MAG TPA: HYR domain-containing protein, partial [Segetibacter sp.]
MRQNFTQKFLTFFAFLSLFAAGYQANAQSQDPCEFDNGGIIAADNGTGTDTTCPRTAPGTFLSTNGGSGVGGGPNITYQWFMRNTNGGQFTAVPNYGSAPDQTGTGPTYTPQALADGVYDFIRFRYSGTELNPRACTRTSNTIQVIAQDRNKPIITRCALDTSVISPNTTCTAVISLPRRGNGTGFNDARGVMATDNCTGNSGRSEDTLRLTYFIGSTQIANNANRTHTFSVGFTTVTARVMDSTGNFSDCNFTVRVTDTTRPSFGASPRLLTRFTEGTGTNLCAANVTGSETNPNYTDCSPMTISYTIFDSTANNGRTTPSTGVSGPSSGTTTTNIGDRTFQRGTYYIRYSAVDTFGNASNTADTLILRVIDNIRPTITAPTNDTFNITSGCTFTPGTVTNPSASSTANCGQTFSNTGNLCTDPISSDNCGVAREEVYGPNNFNFQFNTFNSTASAGPIYDNRFFNVGRNELRYVAFDASGNISDTARQAVFVRDNAAPQVFCQANESLNTSGESRVTAGPTACTF